MVPNPGMIMFAIKIVVPIAGVVTTIAFDVMSMMLFYSFSYFHF